MFKQHYCIIRFLLCCIMFVYFVLLTFCKWCDKSLCHCQFKKWQVKLAFYKPRHKLVLFTEQQQWERVELLFQNKCGFPYWHKKNYFVSIFYLVFYQWLFFLLKYVTIAEQYPWKNIFSQYKMGMKKKLLQKLLCDWTFSLFFLFFHLCKLKMKMRANRSQPQYQGITKTKPKGIIKKIKILSFLLC